MFRAGQPNPYDDIVAKTTDENLTSENWELILNLCDKVNDEGEQGARSVVAAILKRLTHRNANVQLYALTLAEALVKNGTVTVHREIASRAFTQGLEKIITDRTTHDKVRNRTLALIAQWSAEFEKDPSLNIMEECFNNLKAKNYKFDTPQEAPPPEVDDAIRRAEEEELQRVLEMSMKDKGGRNQWQGYTPYDSEGAGPSGSSSGAGSSSTARTSSSSYAGASSASTTPAPRYPLEKNRPSYAAYSPAFSGTPTPGAQGAARSQSPVVQTSTPAPALPAYATHTSVPPTTSPPNDGSTGVVTRVRALHTFEPTEPGELGFEKGEIIKVVDRGYKDWWRGQLKGRTGIFPVNYVEPLPEPTAAELAKEAEQEASVFAQAANVDRLLTMLRQMEQGSAKESLADNEEIQELYRTSMSLRPKIVKLIDKYSQKRADLVSMNETFVKSKAIYDRMMEESMARVDGYARPGYRQSFYPGGPGPQSGPQSYGWNSSLYGQPGYNAYPAPAQAYPPGQEGTYPTLPHPQHTPHPQGPGPHPGQPPPQPHTPAFDPAYQQHQQVGYGPNYGQPGAPPQQQQPGVYPTPTPTPGAPPQEPAQPGYGPGHAYGQPYPQAQPPQTPQPQQQQPAGYPQQQQPQSHAQQQPAEGQPQPQQAGVSGPPYAFDPTGTYPDPNVQAWAQYYAQGGKDPTGSVYFVSVPGVKEAGPGAPHIQEQPTESGEPPHAVRQDSAPYSAGPLSPGAELARNQSLAYNLPPLNISTPIQTHPPHGSQNPHEQGGFIAGPPSAGGDPVSWHQQYTNVTNSVAGMQVAGEREPGSGAPQHQAPQVGESE